MHDARSKNVSFVRARGKFQISLRTKGEERSFFISIPILHSNDTFDNFVDSCQISWDFVTKMIETNDLCVEGRKGETGSKLCCCCEMFSLREKIIFRRKDRKIRLIVNQAWNVLAWETPRFIPLPFSFLSLSLSPPPSPSHPSASLLTLLLLPSRQPLPTIECVSYFPQSQSINFTTQSDKLSICLN